MCGIVGYIGPKDAVPILIEGLKKLEYRGYDSAGIAVCNSSGGLSVEKCKGRLSSLESRLCSSRLSGSPGIGHTRWATHGEPSDINSHPHTDLSGSIAIVHNGIIENYMKIKAYLMDTGVSFASQTDTEVIAHLINHHYDGSLFEAVLKTVNELEGSFALGVISKDEPGVLVAVRKDSPLIIGAGEGENFIASDVPAILEHTRKIYYLNDGEIAVLRASGVEIFDEFGKKVKKDISHITWDVSAAEKAGYEHFMLKEIHEQPKALRDTLFPRLEKDGCTLNFDEIQLDERTVKRIKSIRITACGTASHAGILGKYIIEELCRIPVEMDIASEFRYRNPIIGKDQLFIVISQSGETADTLAAMREAKKRGAHVLAITNVVGSSVSREADSVFYTRAGPEIAVASTKAYDTQLMALYMIALHIAKIRGTIHPERYKELISQMKTLPEKAQSVLEHKSAIQRFANKHFAHRSIFFIGRNLDYAVSMEASLKLKEISYIHSEAYAGGELKHGTIALIEDGTLVIALCTQPALYEKIFSNIKEV
ncbi:MAG: glutamine--fructose-6-phosphate transaminase (isomerizing), partial [Bacillota bacterium]|nr:glutamine--fructose-6-phosphate transaminase (isomerizing) [Bacillota bacterium]